MLFSIHRGNLNIHGRYLNIHWGNTKLRLANIAIIIIVLNLTALIPYRNTIWCINRIRCILLGNHHLDTILRRILP
jgi:hypothetical protein